MSEEYTYKLTDPIRLSDATEAPAADALVALASVPSPAHLEVSSNTLRAHFYNFPDKNLVEVYVHRFGNIPESESRNIHRVFLFPASSLEPYRNFVVNVVERCTRGGEGWLRSIGRGNEHQEEVKRLEALEAARKAAEEKKRKAEEKKKKKQKRELHANRKN